LIGRKQDCLRAIKDAVARRGKLQETKGSDMRLNLVGAVLGTVLAAGCATSYRDPASASSGDRMEAVANQPFADLNLSGVEIPPILVRARSDPFAMPGDCDGIDREIAGLSHFLGPALSSRKKPAPSGNNDADFAWGAARGAVGGLIPFRGVVRWISGADRRDRHVQEAVLAGYVRRAYLEGIREGQNCTAQVLSARSGLP
jgi:hypothetical protein